MVKKVLTFAASNQGAEATHALLALQALADGTYVSLSKPVSQGAVLLLHTMCTRQNKKQTRRPNTQKGPRVVASCFPLLRLGLKLHIVLASLCLCSLPCIASRLPPHPPFPLNHHQGRFDPIIFLPHFAVCLRMYTNIDYSLPPPPLLPRLPPWPLSAGCPRPSPRAPNPTSPTTPSAPRTATELNGGRPASTGWC